MPNTTIHIHETYPGSPDCYISVSDGVRWVSTPFAEKKIAPEHIECAIRNWREHGRFDITPADVGRYVRRKSTGEVGPVRRDAGNGWLHPDFYYEWRAIRQDLEYVIILPDKTHA